MNIVRFVLSLTFNLKKERSSEITANQELYFSPWNGNQRSRRFDFFSMMLG
jgi:hypothetical protein